MQPLQARSPLPCICSLWGNSILFCRETCKRPNNNRAILHMKKFKICNIQNTPFTSVNTSQCKLCKEASVTVNEVRCKQWAEQCSSAHPVCTVIGTLQYSYSFFDSFALCAASPWGSNSIFTETSGPSDLINFIFFFGGFFKVPSLSFTLYSSVLWGIP